MCNSLLARILRRHIISQDPAMVIRCSSPIIGSCLIKKNRNAIYFALEIAESLRLPRVVIGKPKRIAIPSSRSKSLLTQFKDRRAYISALKRKNLFFLKGRPSIQEP